MRNLKEMKIGEGGKIQGNRDSQSYAKTDLTSFHRAEIGKVRVGRTIGFTQSIRYFNDTYLLGHFN